MANALNDNHVVGIVDFNKVVKDLNNIVSSPYNKSTTTKTNLNSSLILGSSFNSLNDFTFAKNESILSYSDIDRHDTLSEAFDKIRTISIDHSKVVHDFVEVNKPIVLDNGNVEIFYQDLYANEYNSDYIYTTYDNIKFALAKRHYLDLISDFTYTPISESHKLFKIYPQISPSTYYVYAFVDQIHNTVSYNKYFGDIDIINGVPYGTQVPYYKNLSKTETVDVDSVEISTYSMSCRKSNGDNVVLKEIEIPELKIYNDGHIDGIIYDNIWLTYNAVDCYLGTNNIFYEYVNNNWSENLMPNVLSYAIKSCISFYSLNSPIKLVKTEKEINPENGKPTGSTYTHVFPSTIFRPVTIYTSFEENTYIYEPFKISTNESSYIINASINASNYELTFMLLTNGKRCASSTPTPISNVVDNLSIKVNDISFGNIVFENVNNISISYSISRVMQDTEYNFVEKYVESGSEAEQNVENLCINIIASLNGETYYKKLYLDKRELDSNEYCFTNDVVLFSKDVIKINESFEHFERDFTYVKFIQEMSSTYNVQYIYNADYTTSYEFLDNLSSIETKKDVLYERNGINVTYAYYSPRQQSYVEYFGSILEFNNVNYGCTLEFNENDFTLLPVFERTRIIKSANIDKNYLTEYTSYVLDNYEDFITTYVDKSLALTNEYDYVFSGYSFVEPEKTILLNETLIPANNIAYSYYKPIHDISMNDISLGIAYYDLQETFSSNNINIQSNELKYINDNSTINLICESLLNEDIYLYKTNGVTLDNKFKISSNLSISLDDGKLLIKNEDVKINNIRKIFIDNEYYNQENILTFIVLVVLSSLDSTCSGKNAILYINTEQRIYFIYLYTYLNNILRLYTIQESSNNGIKITKNKSLVDELETLTDNTSRITELYQKASINEDTIYSVDNNNNTKEYIILVDNDNGKLCFVIEKDSSYNFIRNIDDTFDNYVSSFTYSEAIIRDGYWKRNYKKEIKPLQTLSYNIITNSIDISNAYVVPTTKNELLGFIHENEVSYYDYEEEQVEHYTYVYYDSYNVQQQYIEDDTHKFVDLGNNIYYGLYETNEVSSSNICKITPSNGGLRVVYANISNSPDASLLQSKLNNGFAYYEKKLNGSGRIKLSSISTGFYQIKLNDAFQNKEALPYKIAEYAIEQTGNDVTLKHFVLKNYESEAIIINSTFEIQVADPPFSPRNALQIYADNMSVSLPSTLSFYVECNGKLYYEELCLSFKDSSGKIGVESKNSKYYIKVDEIKINKSAEDKANAYKGEYTGTYNYSFSTVFSCGNTPACPIAPSGIPRAIAIKLPSKDDFEAHIKKYPERYVNLYNDSSTPVNIVQLYRRMTVTSNKRLKEYVVQEDKLVPQYAQIDTPFGLVNGKKVNVIDEIYVPEQYTTVISINPSTYEYETQRIKTTDSYISYTYEIEDIPFITATYLFDGGENGIKIQGFDLLIERLTGSPATDEFGNMLLPSASSTDSISYNNSSNLKRLDKTFNTYLSKLTSSLVYINQAIDHSTSVISNALDVNNHNAYDSYLVNINDSIDNLGTRIKLFTALNTSNEINAQKKMMNSLVESIDNQTSVLSRALLLSGSRSSYAYSSSFENSLSLFGTVVPKNWKSINRTGYQYIVEEQTISYQSEGYKHTKVITKGQRPVKTKKVTRTFEFEEPSYVLFSYANAFEENLSNVERIGLHLHKESVDFTYNGYVYHEDNYTYKNIADILADLHVSNRLPTKNEFIVDVSKRLYINSDFIFSYTSDNEYALRAIRRAQVLWSELQKANIVETPEVATHELPMIKPTIKDKSILPWWKNKQKFAYFAYAFNIDPHKYTYFTEKEFVEIDGIMNRYEFSTQSTITDENTVNSIFTNPHKYTNLTYVLDGKQLNQNAIVKINDALKKFKPAYTNGLSEKIVEPTSVIGEKQVKTQKREPIQKVMTGTLSNGKVQTKPTEAPFATIF